MAASIEIESKALISEANYSKIVKHFESEITKEYDQTNHYIDTKDFTLKQMGIGLRIRNVSSSFVLTLKAPMAEGLLEKDQHISRNQVTQFKKGDGFPDGIIKNFVKMLGVDPEDLVVLAKLTTHRIEVENETTGKVLCIDKNTYNNVTDYELELESNTLEQGKIQLKAICSKVGIEYKENLKSKQSRAMETIA